MCWNGEGGDPLFGGPKNVGMMLHHGYGSGEQPKISRVREIKRQGIFNPDTVQQILRYDLEGQGRYGIRLWMLLTFEPWRRLVIDNEPVWRGTPGFPDLTDPAGWRSLGLLNTMPLTIPIRYAFMALGLGLCLAYAGNAEGEIVSATLPASRSVQVDTPATAFGTIINAGSATATDCGPHIDAASGQFSYHATDSATNAIDHSVAPNFPVDITSGASRSFVFSLTPRTVMEETVVEVVFDCSNTLPAPVIEGLNTLLISSGHNPTPDIVAIAASPGGIVSLVPTATSTASAGAFAVATVNVGVGATITVSADTNGTALPVSFGMCETDPVTSHCTGPLVPSGGGPLALDINAGSTPTFGVFAAASDPIAFDPAHHRVFVRFRDAAGVTRGATSVAIRTCGAGDADCDGQPDSAAQSWSLEPSMPSERGTTPAAVAAILDHVFTDAALQAALLIKDGYAIGARYAPGFGADDHGTSWSVAKSLYGAAVGVAVDEGHLPALDQPASAVLTEWQGTDNHAITIRQILEMRSGIPDTGIFFASDQSAFALSRERNQTPGAAFQYSNPGSQLMEPLLTRSTGMDAHAWLIDRILAPIGINPAGIGLWRDPSGEHALTYCCVDMTIDQFGRFGLLMARGGAWRDEQVVPRDFVLQSLSAQSTFYGLQWWVLNQSFFSGRPVNIDVSAALGLDGQKIYVWPEADVVLVVLTRYLHARERGYVLSLSNFPNTCSARNTCTISAGPTVPAFDQYQLMGLLEALRP
jgi:CubicO group peptidase (beta-lactamase class C family)